MDKINIGIFIGSLRDNSYSKKLAKYIAEKLGNDYIIEFFTGESLPLYNEDLEKNIPESWLNFRKAVKQTDAVLFVTPEYNRSIPPALKNMLDIASLPHGSSAWNGKPGAIISLSPGKLGGFGGSQHIRQTAACLNIQLLSQPEMYLSEIATIIDSEGNISSEKTIIFIDKFINKYKEWILQILK